MNTNDFLKAFRYQAKGGEATAARAISTFKNLQSFAKQSRWSGVDPSTLTGKQTRLYVEHRLSSGAGARTVQNEVSHLRRAIRGAGRDLGDIKDQKNGWSSSRLSVEPSSRLGGRAATSRSAYENAREKVQEPGVRCAMDLQVCLGLRLQEAVKSANVLDWSYALEEAGEKGRGAELHLTDDAGSKGGRERFIYVPADKVELVSEVVERAIEIKKENGGFLIESKDLHSAKDHYGYVLKTVGLSGESSSHGLRRLYAHDQKDAYETEGLDEKTALIRLSGDLGHGPGRARWVQNNYLTGGRS